MLNIIRIRFIRGEEVKFISHLDLMKVFERALRRSRLPIAYSQGFNPHPQMIFGLPLSVGVTSQLEYADFELSAPIEAEVFIDELNKSLPSGLRILDARYKQTKENIMASISAASYVILMSAGTRPEMDKISGMVRDFLQQPEIIVKKEGKSGVKDVNIKPMIIKLEASLMDDGNTNNEAEGSTASGSKGFYAWLKKYVESQTAPGILRPSYSMENLFYVKALLSAGSVANLKPELLFAAFRQFAGSDLKLVKIHRDGLFVSKDGELVDPLDNSAL